MQQMQVTNITVQCQMQALLVYLQQATQPPHTPQQPPSQPAQLMPPPPLLAVPPATPVPPQVPPSPAGPMGASTAPPLVANPPGRSLPSYFPDVKPTLLLVITKHEFDPGQLFKINPQMKDKPRDTKLQLSDAGILIKAERDTCVTICSRR